MAVLPKNFPLAPPRHSPMCNFTSVDAPLGADPESRVSDSGFDAPRRPGMTISTVDSMPDPVGCRRHLQSVVADRIGNGVDHGSRRADRAGLAATLDAQGIAGTQRR